MSNSSRFIIASFLMVLFLSGCGGPLKREASYPTRPSGTDKIVYSNQKRATVGGSDISLSKKLFGGSSEKSSGSGIGVNSFLWRASLDTISFMPVASADPFGGVIITDWYENPEIAGERFKLNIYILDKHLRADGLRVSVFKQKMKENHWRNVKLSSTMASTMENTILTRAREMRIAQLGGE